MKLGVAKSCITPEMPVRLCGYAKRKGTFEGVLEDIYITQTSHIGFAYAP